MTRKTVRVLMVLACMTSVGCGGGGEPTEEADEAPSAEAAAESQITISPEALALAGIRVGPAERRALAGGTSIPAEVQFEPNSTAHVGPLVPGRITRVDAALGDRVTRGQLLGMVASTDVSLARTQLQQARARLTAAESTLARQQQLASDGIGAQRSLIDAEAQVSELRSEVQGLGRQLSVYGSGSGGQLALTAPIDGVVVDVHATLGEVATPDRAAFVITDPSKLWVSGDVPELEISRVQHGAAAIVRIHAFPDLALSGTISYVAPGLDETTRSLPIRVTLSTPDARLLSGLFGSIELVGGAVDERVLVVPMDALATVRGQQVVFVPGTAPNTFRAQPVAVGRRAAGYFEIRSGLTEGARIVMSGAFTLKSALQSNELVGEE